MVKTERERILGKTVGDVLKAVHTLQDGDANTVALPSDIAAHTGTSRAFVTKMLQTMGRKGLLEYVPYRGVRLTDAGAKSAVELARHHRLLEVFLTDVLGFSPENAHDEAERLEHVISEEFEDRLAAFLQHPTVSPDGAPIPNADGTMPPALTPQPPLPSEGEGEAEKAAAR